MNGIVEGPIGRVDISKADRPVNLTVKTLRQKCCIHLLAERDEDKTDENRAKLLVKHVLWLQTRRELIRNKTAWCGSITTTKPSTPPKRNASEESHYLFTLSRVVLRNTTQDYLYKTRRRLYDLQTVRVEMSTMATSQLAQWEKSIVLVIRISLGKKSGKIIKQQGK